MIGQKGFEMFVDLNANEGEWFPFQNSKIDPLTGEPMFDDPDTDAKVQIRSMTPFFEERIAKRKYVVERVFNAKTRQMDRDRHMADLTVEEAKEERDDAFDFAITGLSGFKDAKTKTEIACTRENKIALMRVPAFDRFFAKCQQELASSGIKEEAEKKTSVIGSASMTNANPE